MGWLSGYTYRMDVPVAQPSTSGNRLLTIPFPAWFLLAQGKITSGSYNDVHVTTSDGTTELACTTTAKSIAVDYPAIPQGRTTLYVYYGKSGASAPTASSYVAGATESGGTLIDSGLDSGSGSIGSPWTITAGSGTGAAATYDAAGQGYAGSTGLLSTKAAKLVSGTTGGTYMDTAALSSLTADTAELRFWVTTPADTAASHIIYDKSGASGTFYLDHAASGVIRIYSDRTSPANTTGYGTAGYHTLNATWAASTLYQYRVIFNFTNHTYTVDRRVYGGSWTSIYKAASSAAMPMRSGSVSSVGVVSFFVENGVSANRTIWYDEVQYANGGITDTPGASSVVQVIGANGEVTSEGDTSPTDYIWGDDLDATYLNSGATSTYYGGSSSHKVGVTTGGEKYHYLFKPGEWMLRKGVTSAATLHLYASAVAAGDIDVRCHRFKNDGAESADARTRQDQWVRNGWTCNDKDSYPTWTNRYYNQAYAGATAWRTAGATDSGEIDSSTYVTLSVAGGAAAGYKSLSLTASWIDDWATTDYYAQGLLLKDSTDSAGGSDRQLTITAPSQANSPVLQIDYTSVEADQLSKRKLTSDTYHASTFAVQNRYCLTPSENSHAVMCQVNAEMGLDFFYISSTGRIRRVLKNQRYSSNKFSSTSPCWGLHYDETEGRFWVMGVYGSTQTLVAGYTSAYVLDAPTWTLPGVSDAYKGTFYVNNGSLRCLYPLYAQGSSPNLYDILVDRTFTRSTATWGSATTVYQSTQSGTTRTLGTTINSSDVMTGSGTITLSGSAASFPSFGAVVIESEVFWYTGTSGSTLTGVTRAMNNTSAATHSSGTAVIFDQWEPTYVAMSYDSTNNRLHAIFQIVSFAGQATTGWPPNRASFGSYTYNYTVAMAYNFAASVWEKADGTDLSLPLTNANLSNVITRSNSPAYTMNLLALANGTTLTSFGEYPSTISSYPTDGAFWENTRVGRLSSGSWSSVDAPDGYEASLTDLGSGLVQLTSVTGTTTPTVQKATSGDSGATWSGAASIATHSFATPNTLAVRNSIWCSDSTERGALGGRGVVYWQHFAPHGALYVQGLVYPVTKTYTADGIIANLKTYTADAIIASRPTVTYTADAVIRGAFTATYTADAIVQSAGTTVSYTADAIVQDYQHTKTYTADAIVFGTSVLTYTADARIEAESGSATRALSWFFRRRRSSMSLPTKTYTSVQAKGTTRTATWTSPTYKSETEAGILVVLDVTAASGSGGLTLRINAHDLAGSVAVPLNSAPTAVTATGTTSYAVYPFGAISGALTQSTSGYLPRQFSITVTHGDSSSYTYSVGFCLLP